MGAAQKGTLSESNFGTSFGWRPDGSVLLLYWSNLRAHLVELERTSLAKQTNKIPKRQTESSPRVHNSATDSMSWKRRPRAHLFLFLLLLAEQTISNFVHLFRSKLSLAAHKEKHSKFAPS